MRFECLSTQSLSASHSFHLTLDVGKRFSKEKLAATVFRLNVNIWIDEDKLFYEKKMDSQVEKFTVRLPFDIQIQSQY